MFLILIINFCFNFVLIKCLVLIFSIFIYIFERFNNFIFFVKFEKDLLKSFLYNNLSIVIHASVLSHNDS